MNYIKKNKYKILVFLNIIALFIFLTINNIASEKVEIKNKIIEMDAVVSYSCSEYTVFTTAEFSSFVVFNEPIRDYYDSVILSINTQNTSITSDDEVVKVEDRDPDVSNSSGGDIYEYR